jgi:hypothetical protein
MPSSSLAPHCLFLRESSSWPDLFSLFSLHLISSRLARTALLTRQGVQHESPGGAIDVDSGLLDSTWLFSASTTSPTIPLTCPALLLHSNLHSYNHLFVKGPSSLLYHQVGDTPVHLESSAPTHRRYSINVDGLIFQKA